MNFFAIKNSIVYCVMNYTKKCSYVCLTQKLKTEAQIIFLSLEKR